MPITEVPLYTGDRKDSDMPEMTEENLRAALAAQVEKGKGGSDDLNMSKEEVDKFTKAFAEPEFRKLMADYVDEISDPKNRAETDAYIRQLENQGEVPEDKEIIRPDACYVVKFKHAKVALRDAAKAKNEVYEKEKMFVNIVASDKIDPPTSKIVTVKGQRGRQWMIPHSLGPVRMEHDKTSLSVPTLDCCFHPETIDMSLKVPGFKDLVVETARETCVRGFKNVKDDVEIDKKYHKKPAGPKEPALKKGFMTAKKTTRKGDGKGDAKTGGGGRRGGGETSDGKSIPFYTVSESGHFDLTNHTMADSEAPLFSNRPASLIYRIELPEEKSAADLDLDVSEKKITLTSSTYSLNTNLIYPCEGDKGKAKWDKKKNVLTVTVPVMKPSAQEIEDMKAKQKVVEVVSSSEVEEVGEKLEKAEVSGDDQSATSSEPPPPPPKPKSTREAFAVDAPIPTNNAAAEMYTEVKKGSKGSKAKVNKEPSPKKEQLVKVEGDFAAAAKFDGSRSGYVFKKGKEGVGYYKDGAKTGGGGRGGKAKKGKEPGKAKASASASTSNDKFEYRQSEKTVTILIQVSGIDADSVSADFKAHSVKITFKEINGTPHTFFLENLFAEIDIEESRFDVATKNMIVILGKKEHKNVWRTLVGVPGMKGGGGEKKEKKGEQKKSKQTKKAPSSDGVVNSSQSFSKKTSEIMFDLD
ncbi:hypothetical protein TrRE_jg5265 [Triparma retinervis]|uniref:PIH1 domain-containing protein 1 n=1 Tax=Triparma retinervis TaxID=2557542 RepID=A0A9W6Z9X6_9STRA|nr:hypothetical protein TrRE_jg5265 [Triparma retinervis]